MPFVLAFSVHLLTASGAVLAMLALLAAAGGDWATMYVWLMVALIVDGIDGPLARAAKIKENAPQWDGALLDLIIDYLTYVFIPAYALFTSGLFVGWTGWLSTGIIVFTAVIYFADTRMKTADNSFSGFPGCWNMVVLVFFALTPPWQVMLFIIAALAILQFFPVKFVHPVRTDRWRVVSLPMIVVWTVAAILAAWTNFEGVSPLVYFALILSSLYLLCAGAVQQITEPRGK
jgi:phosphatidylcholine synthase